MEYQLNCEIKCCRICNEFIEQTNKLVIINHKHYHRDCIILCRVSSHTQKLVPLMNPSVPSYLPSPH
jgi:late competence protein required for DNA uptake (superfamily II DNA/RNA helicase)